MYTITVLHSKSHQPSAGISPLVSALCWYQSSAGISPPLASALRWYQPSAGISPLLVSALCWYQPPPPSLPVLQKTLPFCVVSKQIDSNLISGHDGRPVRGLILSPGAVLKHCGARSTSTVGGPGPTHSPGCGPPPPAPRPDHGPHG